MKTLNEIACNLNWIESKIGFKYIEWNFNSISIQQLNKLKRNEKNLWRYSKSTHKYNVGKKLLKKTQIQKETCPCFFT